MEDIIDQLFNAVKNGADLTRSVREPQKHKSGGGADIFGFPAVELGKAALYYAYYCKNMHYDQGRDLLAQMKISITIEELALLFKQALYNNIRGLSGAAAGEGDLNLVVLELYSRFSGKPVQEIQGLLDNQLQIYTDLWREIVPDEDAVTPAQLAQFYNSLPFPVGTFLPDSRENSLVTAYRTLPVMLAQASGARAVFDFGGNSGLITSVMAAVIELDSCMLIEENEELLRFARWRDNLGGISNVAYKKTSEIYADITPYEEKFDLGVCMEVLEHLYDVEEAVAATAKLLKPGGLLYQTTSFGLYPEPSHLKKNTRYAGREDDLLRKFGLERIQLDFPIPLLGDIRIYRKS